MRNRLSLVLFLLLVVGGGSTIGLLNLPGGWYAGLVKPSFNPPNWIFGPVWTALYVIIAVVGWRIWEAHRASPAMTFWWAQLILNFLWSPAFFGFHSPGLGLVIIGLMLVSIIAFIVSAWRIDRLSAFLFLPYLAWVSFASLLNAAIFVLN